MSLKLCSEGEKQKKQQLLSKWSLKSLLMELCDLQKNKVLIKEVFPTGKSHPLCQTEENSCAREEGGQLFKVPM